MAAVLLRSGQAPGSSTANEWYPLAANTHLQRQTPESRRRTTHRSAGTLSGFSVTVTASSSTRTVVVRKNDADANQTVSVSSGTTGVFTDSTNTDSVSAGDTLDYAVSGTGLTISSFSCAFQPAANTAQRVGSIPNVSISATTNFAVYGGVGNQSDGNIANVQWQVRAAGTWKNLAVFIQANTRDGSVTIAGRVGTGADGALTVTVPTTTTGLFEDTSNTMSIAVSDNISLHATFGGTTGSITVDNTSSDFVTTTGNSMAGVCGNVALNANLTRYLPVGGGYVSLGVTANTDVQGPASIACTAEKLLTLVTTNTVSADSTVGLQVGGSTSALVVTVPSNTSGTFESTTESVALVAADLINWIIATGATGTSFGSMRIIQMQMVASDAVARRFLLVR